MGAKTWMSPVQPRRSSRCGQSVGMSTKLPCMLHSTFSCRRFRSGVGGLEPAGAFHVGVVHPGCDVFGDVPARPATDLGIAEAVES